MTDRRSSQRLAVDAARRLLPGVFDRLDALRGELVDARERQAELAATVEQLARQVARMEAYQQVSLDSIRQDYLDLLSALPDTPEGAGPADALRLRFDHALLHAEALAEESRTRFAREIGELRNTLRLSQAMERRASAGPGTHAAAEPAAGPDAAAERPVSIPPARSFAHPTPDFDLLYRAFEDHHRGSPADIRSRQRDDYLELIAGLGHPELPVVDLGCGRGELVELLGDEGHRAIGVDVNLGQIADAPPDRFEQADLFEWLDARDDGSCRAIVSLHVVEHLPVDLQVRLVFEARRVLADGGVLVLETPNTLSLSTAASNFWVDPTHERPVHPMFLEFLAAEAGFATVQTRQLHPLPIGFSAGDGVPELVEELDSLIFGAGDLAMVAAR